MRITRSMGSSIFDESIGWRYNYSWSQKKRAIFSKACRRFCLRVMTRVQALAFPWWSHLCHDTYTSNPNRYFLNKNWMNRLAAEKNCESKLRKDGTTLLQYSKVYKQLTGYIYIYTEFTSERLIISSSFVRVDYVYHLGPMILKIQKWYRRKLTMSLLIDLINPLKRRIRYSL